MGDGAQPEAPGRGISTRLAEAVTSTAVLAVGGLVMVDSVRVGWGWASDGPQAGFYPFYVGLVLCASAAWMLLRQATTGQPSSRQFVAFSQLRPVLAIFLPSVAFVAAIFFLGIYASSALFLIAFMRWQGKFGWPKVLAVGLVTPLVMFLIFEAWFKLPLPKGPLEVWLGY
jgi:putative tricarboxylic transport membrane protein